MQHYKPFYIILTNPESRKIKHNCQQQPIDAISKLLYFSQTQKGPAKSIIYERTLAQEHVLYIPKNSFRSLSSYEQINSNKQNTNKKSKNFILFQNKDMNVGNRRSTISTVDILALQKYQENYEQLQPRSSRQKRSIIKIADFNANKILDRRQKQFLNEVPQQQKMLTTRDHKNSFRSNEDWFIIKNINLKKKPDIEKSQNSPKIPCFFIKSKSLNNEGKILVYYHGNGQDLISCYPFVKLISIYMNMDALIVQYPTYSIYNSVQSKQKMQGQKSTFYHRQDDKEQCTQSQIQNDSIDIMHHLIKLGYQSKDIILIGRSIGTGVVINLATIFKVRAVVLLSPFTSVKAIVKNMFGELASLLLKQRFNSIQKMVYVQSPVLIIHGMMDKMIPYNHSLQLSKKATGYCCVKLVPEMTHSQFHYEKDFLIYLNDFIRSLNQDK